MKCGHCDEKAKKTQHMRICKALPHCQHDTGVHSVCNACWDLAFGDAPPEPVVRIKSARLTKAQKEELARFFSFAYYRALQLDPRGLPDNEDVVRSLAGIRGAAKGGYYDVTGEWLSPQGGGS